MTASYFKLLSMSRFKDARWSSVPNSRITPTNSFSFLVTVEPDGVDIWPDVNCATMTFTINMSTTALL